MTYSVFGVTLNLTQPNLLLLLLLLDRVSKSSHLQTLRNFVKSWPIFKPLALLESVWNLQHTPYDITYFTLGMLLQYTMEN